MFRKLRNKFLVINLILTSIIMIVSFSAIYLMTYNNIYGAIEKDLERAAEFRLRPIEKQPPPNFDKPPQDLMTAVYIQIDNSWNIVKTDSIFTIEDSEYNEIVEEIQVKDKSKGQLKIDEIQWIYKIQPVNSGFDIICIDITARQTILVHLIYTFAIVSVITFIAILWISKIFADKAIKPIQDAFEKQKRFVADASHELKTPLTVINTNIDLVLESKEETVASAEKWLLRTKNEVERMSKLTNDLLYLARMDQYENPILLTPLDLSEELQNVLLAMEAVFYENKIEMKNHIEENIVVQGNKELLHQVIMILLDNSLKYVDANGQIDIKLTKQQNIAVLSISNTGEGIKKEHLEKIFDRFYRTDDSRNRKTGGYGLGLAIAKAIIQKHNGKIGVNSIPNEKTTFEIKLPC